MDGKPAKIEAYNNTQHFKISRIEKIELLPNLLILKKSYFYPACLISAMIFMIAMILKHEKKRPLNIFS